MPQTSAGPPWKTGSSPRPLYVRTSRFAGSNKCATGREKTESTSASHNSTSRVKSRGSSRVPMTGVTTVPCGDRTSRQESTRRKPRRKLGPNSSDASLNAASSAVSPGSTWPPGNDTWLACVDRLELRMLNTMCGAPSISQSGTRTAAVRAPPAALRAMVFCSAGLTSGSGPPRAADRARRQRVSCASVGGCMSAGVCAACICGAPLLAQQVREGLGVQGCRGGRPALVSRVSRAHALLSTTLTTHAFDHGAVLCARSCPAF
mmetsp:Transcript_14971/g.44715  ORF Transcript_14971/g.44715 Transcript_14971/m.44715 type:complete len:262 (-) Transcript_14971:23-808(-)